MTETVRDDYYDTLRRCCQTITMSDLGWTNSPRNLNHRHVSLLKRHATEIQPASSVASHQPHCDDRSLYKVVNNGILVSEQNKPSDVMLNHQWQITEDCNGELLTRDDKARHKEIDDDYLLKSFEDIALIGENKELLKTCATLDDNMNKSIVETCTTQLQRELLMHGNIYDMSETGEKTTSFADRCQQQSMDKMQKCDHLTSLKHATDENLKGAREQRPPNLNRDSDMNCAALSTRAMIPTQQLPFDIEESTDSIDQQRSTDDTAGGHPGVYYRRVYRSDLPVQSTSSHNGYNALTTKVVLPDHKQDAFIRNSQMSDGQGDGFGFTKLPNPIITIQSYDNDTESTQNLRSAHQETYDTFNMDSTAMNQQKRAQAKVHPECSWSLQKQAGIVNHKPPAGKSTAWEDVDTAGVFSGYSDKRPWDKGGRPKLAKTMSVDETYGYRPRTRLSSASQREFDSGNKKQNNKQRRISLQVYDISGESYEARFPWQRDIAIQCNLHKNNTNANYSNNNNNNNNNNNISATNDRMISHKPPAVRPNHIDVIANMDYPAARAPHRPRASSYSDHTNTRKESPRAKSSFGEAIPKAASSDNISQLTQSSSVPPSPSPYKGQSGWFVSDTTKGNLKKSRRHAMSTSDVEAKVSQTLKEASDMLELNSSLTRDHKRTGSKKRVRIKDIGSTDTMDELESIMLDYGVTESTRNDSGEEILSPPMSRECKLKLVPMLSVDISSTGCDLASRSDTLISPRVSPVPWQQGVPDVVVTASDPRSPGGNCLSEIGSNANSNNRLKVPNKVLRRTSSGSIQSQSDESDSEPSPPTLRRGRRQAIFDSKSLGLVSPTNIDDVSPSTSCDELDSASMSSERLGRKRSSVELGMHYPGDLLVQEHHKKVLIKRNTIADFAATKSHYGSTASLYAEHDTKKLKGTFSLLKLIDKKSRTKESISNLDDTLRKLKRSEFKDSHLMSYKGVHWSELIASTDKDADPNSISGQIPETERKRREAVWELFKSECVFLIDHLMVLKHCFMEPIKKVQVEGQLMFAEPQDMFGNLDEICYVSYTFCRDFISLLLKDVSATEFGRTEVLLTALQRFSNHSRDGEVYHNYCLNYSKAVSYLDHLRRNDDFCEFEKWCEQDPRCNRLQLSDLLISPMQHCTKMPLLLSNIRKYTVDAEERIQLTESLDKLETSLKNLEAKMKWLKNYERVQEIQQQIIWQPISEIDPRAFIPEFLKTTLQKQPCERLLASPKRQLLHEGPLFLIEMSKSLEMYLFLFDDILLLTKIKKSPRKKSSETGLSNQRSNTDGAVFVVHRQPIALDRFTIHEVKPHDAQVNGIKYALVLVQISRFQQIIGVYTLQAPNDTVKFVWLNHLRSAQKRYKEACENKKQSPGSSPTNPAPKNVKYDVTKDNKEHEQTSHSATSKQHPVVLEKLPENNECNSPPPVRCPTRTVPNNAALSITHAQQVKQNRNLTNNRNRVGILKACHERSQTIDAVYL